jgi:lipid II:glycine glycyltransferase (peptidoglycan interpeptide bridge formation enzyme)
MRENSIARIFVAFYKGEPLAAFEIFFFHDRAYYPYGGTASVHRNIPGAAYLMWQAMLTAKREGNLVFDLWGSLPPGYTRKHSWQGFTFFKKRFGSTFVHMTPSHDLVISSGMYWIYTCVYFLRKLIWKTGVV